jgi:DNA-binding response OmpR family regulator
VTASEARHIIIVDDDECVREAMDMILTGAGHHVRSTPTGAEALAWLDAEPCDLLIIDYKMPDIDGPTLYRRAMTRWPVGGPRILFVSGYAEFVDEHDPEILAIPLLHKPFKLGDLFSVVTRILAPTEPGQSAGMGREAVR